MSFLNYFISGLSLGAVYAIIALGYTMVYGIAKMLNFAHGDVIMVGAYTAFYTLTMLSNNSLIVILLASLICMCLGLLIEFLAYRPLRNANSLSVLITAIGVSYFLQNSALLLFGANPKSFSSIVSFGAIKLFDGALTITSESIITIVACIVIMLLLTFFVNKTKFGIAMQAVSEDRGASTLMGISVNKTISLTFAIGSFLAGIAGVLLCSSYPTLSSTTGAMPGIKAFVAAVIGGIGSIPGAFIGGLLLGVLENLSKAYISSQLSDAIVFSLLIIMLLVKPQGILGKKINEKV